MTLQKVSITENIRLSYISTKKFKSELISFSLSAPITERSYLLSLVLCGVLRRGTNALPSMALINKRLDELYASTVDIQSSIHADVLTLCVSAEILSQRFSLDGTDILGGVTDTVADILLSPLTEDGCFPAKTVESEIAFVKVRTHVFQRLNICFQTLRQLHRASCGISTIQCSAQGSAYFI